MNEFIQTLCSRKSCKRYLPTQIKDEELEQVLRAQGRWMANAEAFGW